MKNNNKLDGLFDKLPDAAKNLKNEMESIGDSLLKSKLNDFDLVSREEFEEQKLVLKALLEKVSRIEQALDGIKSDQN